MNYENNVNNEMQNTNQNTNIQNDNINNGTPISSYNQQQTQYNIVNEKKKKPKYWLIPILVFFTGVVSQVIGLMLKIVEPNSNVISFLFSVCNMIFYICMLAFLPCVILAIILHFKNK